MSFFDALYLVDLFFKVSCKYAQHSRWIVNIFCWWERIQFVSVVTNKQAKNIEKCPELIGAILLIPFNQIELPNNRTIALKKIDVKKGKKTINSH